ncbi:MAG TPA: hypothetical protein DDW27_12605 [Bacteroidales bacterium]|nr:hypothetical protein [Bacteroidales bacterium]
MANVFLVKDGQRRPFSINAAKIAIEHFGWSEITTPPKPLEVGTKTKPTIIDKPVKLKEFPIEKANDDLAEIPKTEIIQPDVDSGNTETEVPVKKTRKSPVKSKSKAK